MGPVSIRHSVHVHGLTSFSADAPSLGTVYFSSPLYRKNLHYSVVPKPDKAEQQIAAMRDYILDKHPNDTGIIYCFSIKVKQILSVVGLN